MSSVQTMKTWPRVINSYEEVPRAFIDSFNAFYNTEKEFPYTVFVPPIKNMKIKSDAKMMCTHDRKFYILSKEGTRISTTTYDFENIDYFLSGSILLYSWITIGGLSEGVLTSSVIEFNSVAQDYFLNFINIFRESVLDFGIMDSKNETSKFDCLCTVNYKFMYFAKESLKNGENVIYMALQPEVKAQLLKILGKSIYKTQTRSHLHILTDKELIIIEDADKEWISRYGGVCNYIPLNKIKLLEYGSNEPNGLLYLTIRLKGGAEFKYIFSQENKHMIEMLQKEISSITSNEVLECV